MRLWTEKNKDNKKTRERVRVVPPSLPTPEERRVQREEQRCQRLQECREERQPTKKTHFSG
jgi:hypothetical protein